MKRNIFVMITMFCLVLSMIPTSAFASDESRKLVAFPWYYVDSVEEDSVTLNIRKDYPWNSEELNSIEVIHTMVVAEKITTNGSTIYKAVSGAKSDNKHLKITELKRERNLSGGQYDLIEYLLEPNELGTYSVSYDGMHAEVEVTLPVLGYYSKPEATLENCLKNNIFTFEKGKENVFYIIIPEEIACTITEFSATEMNTENTFLLEQMPGYSHRYKVTVKEPKGCASSALEI